MAHINFNAQEFDSQQIPDALPEYVDPFPADCGLTADQKSDLGKHSEFVGHMDTPAKVVSHWAHVAQARAQREQLLASETKKDPLQRAKEAQAKAERNHVVMQANIAWREAVAQRKRILLEQDELVRAAHEAYSRAKMGAV
jgi:hypothetical protein